MGVVSQHINARCFGLGSVIFSLSNILCFWLQNYNVMIRLAYLYSKDVPRGLRYTRIPPYAEEFGRWELRIAYQRICITSPNTNRPHITIGHVTSAQCVIPWMALTNQHPMNMCKGNPVLPATLVRFALLMSQKRAIRTTYIPKETYEPAD